MILQHITGVLYHPNEEWKSIERDRTLSLENSVLQLMLLALIPPVSLFIGTTQVGWSIGLGENHLLSMGSAGGAAVAFYMAILLVISGITYSIRWMEKTYGANAGIEQCARLTLYTATPMLLAGLIGLYPMLWLCVSVAMLAVAFSVYLLYTGVPVIMHIEEERAFMFSTSIMTVGLVALVSVLAASVILWSTVVPINIIS